MNLRNLQILLFFILALSFSCTPYKRVPYFQDLQRDSVTNEKITNFSQLTIQPGDLLALHVTSLNHDADAPFNYSLEQPSGITTTVDKPEEGAVVGYLVDQGGNIKLPVVGLVKVSGYNTAEISNIIEAKLSELLSNPVVDVRIQNFKIAVLGDVKSPGTFVIQNERITLPEALSLAGDLNTTGIRTNVLLVREIDGVRKYVPFDLTSKKIFDSPYYYLKNHDVIYVQPNKERVNNDGTAFVKASLALTIISIFAILFSKHF